MTLIGNLIYYIRKNHENSGENGKKKMSEIEVTVQCECPKCGHKFEEETLAEIEPMDLNDLD